MKKNGMLKETNDWHGVDGPNGNCYVICFHCYL